MLAALPSEAIQAPLAQTHLSNSSLRAPPSLLPSWWPLPLPCRQGVQMASREVGPVRESKGTVCHLAGSGVSDGSSVRRGQWSDFRTPALSAGLESGQIAAP